MDATFHTQIRQAGHPVSLPSNQPLPCDRPVGIWLVESGEIALFRVAPAAGTIPAARHYLFSVTAGAAIASIPSQDEGIGQILAIAIAPTELVQVPPEAWQNWLEDSHPDAVTLATGWLQQCQSCADTLSTEVERHDAAIISPQFFSPDTEITSATIAQANINFLQFLVQVEQSAHLADWEHFQIQDQVSYQISTAAIAGLASVLNPVAETEYRPSPTTKLTPEQQEIFRLLQVVQIVTQATGIPLRPLKFETLSRTPDPLQTIVQAARLQMRRVLLSDRWWRQDCGPLLAYTRQDNCPVALIPTAPGRYELVDPEHHTRSPINSQTRATLAPVAYMFYRALPERAIDLWDVWHFSRRGTAHDWRLVVGSGLAIVGLGMLLPQGIAILIDQVVPNADRALLVQLGVGLLATVLGGLVFQLVQGTALLRIETLMEASTQAAFWDRVLSLPVPFFRQFAIGDLRERVSVISSIRSQVSGTVLRTLFTSLFALFNLLLLVYYGGQLAWVAIAVAVVMGLVTITASRLMLRQLTPLQALEGRLFGLMVQLIQGVAKLRVSGAEARTFAHWGQQYQRQQQLKLNLQQVEDALLVFNQLLPILSAAIIFSFAAPTSPWQLTQKLSIGTFLAFNVAFGSFMMGLTDLSNTLLSVLLAVVVWRRAKPILWAMPEVDAGKTDPGHLSGQLRVHQVTFQYRPDTPAILQDVTIAVEPGEFVAIVGPSGSGKSTLFRLLLGFEQPQSGQIFYDGHDLCGLDIHAVRRQLGVLLQNSRTSTASIFDNIAGNALITMDEAWDAAHYAGLAEDISRMPMGMHTVVSEGGSNLSGGQRQRLLIARALALKPRILLFDEATSSLDNRTQAIVSESLDRLRMTRIVIAHRLSTIQNADRIYVLQRGRIVQQGRFAELIQQDGLFQQLMQQQIT
jgi:ATP-binding cassette subfamily C protein